MILLWTFIALFVAWICIKHHQESKAFPPGYPRYPLVGSFVSMNGIGSHIAIESLKYGDKYGTDKLFGVFIGPFLRILIIKDYQLASQMANAEVFNGRKTSNWKGILRNKGVLFAERETWKHNRRSSLRALKDLGFGQTRMSYIIEEESKEILDMISQYHGQDMRMHNLCHLNAFNVIWRLVANKRFQKDDEDIQEILKFLQCLPDQTTHPLLLPVKLLFGQMDTYGITRYRTLMHNFMDEAIEEHKVGLDDLEQSQSFIEAYLKDMRRNPELSQDNLKALLFDFFEAGSETVATTMSWVLLYLSLYPDIQEKCVEELHRVLGNKNVLYEQKKKLPYIEATIMECQRMCSTLHSSLMHVVQQDTVFEGYKIPQGTMTYFCIYKFHMDPAVWGDPKAMRPERFLNEDGTGVIKKEQFIPFGMGKRFCLGESLAKMELFLFTVHILRRFKLSPPKHHEASHKDNAGVGAVRYPMPFYVHIERRT